MVAPDQGKIVLVAWLLDMDSIEYPAMTLHLYKNDYTPVDASVTSDFTESDFSGFEVVPILRSEMTELDLIAHIAYITRSTAPEFSCDGGTGQLAYGWYLTDDDEDTTILAQRFDEPFNMTNGSSLSIDPFRVGLQTLH